jgi:hypothetical protein
LALQLGDVGVQAQDVGHADVPHRLDLGPMLRSQFPAKNNFTARFS